MPVLFFGRLGDLTADEPSGPTDSESFRQSLSKIHPDLASPTVRIAVNGELTQGSVPVAPGDEIAFLPPMSGG